MTTPQPVKKRSDTPIAFWAIGTLIALIGAIVWGSTNSQYKACSNAFISAFDQSQCNNVDAWHTIGVFGFCVGIILVLIGVVVYVQEK